MNFFSMMIPLVCRFLSIFLMFRSIPNLCKQSSCLQTFLLHTFSTQIASLIIWICHFKVYTLCNSLPCFGTHSRFCAYFLSIRLQQSTQIWFDMIHTACVFYYFLGCNLHILRTVTWTLLTIVGSTSWT